MKKLMPLYMAALIAAFLVSGCGSSKKEPREEEEAPAGIAFVGITTCFNCHADSRNPASFPPVFGDTAGDAWLASRHGNQNDTPSYADITDVCTPCHDPQGDGHHLEDLADVGAPLGTNRPIVGCEACHGPGGNHWGIGPLGNDFDEAGVLFRTCSGCHPVDPAKNFHSDLARIITDTHVDNPDTAIIEGYVLNPNGFHSDEVGNENNGTCTDCHHQHDFGLTINEEWFVSAHAGFLGLNPVGLTDPPFATNEPPFVEDDFKSPEESRCQRCHTSTGFRNIANNQDGYDPANNVFVATGQQRELIYCWACHYNNEGGIRPITTGGAPGVKFPSGLVANLDDPPEPGEIGAETGGSRTCMMCHQGRESGISVQREINTSTTHQHTFINIHYFAAAASFFGSEVIGGYQYGLNPGIGPAGRTYTGSEQPFLIATEEDDPDENHVTVDKITCAGCHMRLGEETPGDLADHHFVPELADCTACHDEGAADFEDMRFDDNTDYDGDGNTSEGMFFELQDISKVLLAAIQDYATNIIGTPIAYTGTTYPYFFKDTNGNGIVDPGEDTFANRYNLFDDTLLTAAYNYQMDQKEPCGYIHNRRYIIQIMIDSIDAVGGDTSDMIRPAGESDS
jgi:hypothetical protein